KAKYEKKLYEEMLENSNNPIVKMLLLHILLLEDHKKALDFANEFPDSIILNILKIICLETLGKFEEAVEICDKLLVSFPKSVLLLTKKAQTLARLGRYEEALKYTDEALKIENDNYVLMYLKGLILHRLGRYEEAYKIFKKLVEDFNVEWLDVIKNLVSLCLELEKYEEAIKYAELGLKHREDDVVLLASLGEAYEKLGDKEKALKLYKKCLSLYPNYIRVLLNLARLYEKDENVEKAVEYYKKLLDAKKHRYIK
ncbi:tetratricopeptide repeat protein, partial [Methanocaldococcus sp.]